MVLLLNREVIERVLSMEDAIDTVEAAFGELASGSVDMPQRLTIADAERAGTVLCMPAYLKGMGALGVKTVTVYKNNPEGHNLPTVLATVTLLDQETGSTLSVMDGGFLTALRTGAASGVATKYLARKDARVAGVFGAGAQARTQLWATCTVRDIERAVVHSVDSESVKRAFAERMSEKLNIEVEIAQSGREVVEKADVLCLATTSAGPIIDGDWLRPGTHINGVGSHSPGAREIDTKTIVNSKIVCDLTSACLAEAGDLMMPVQEGALSPDGIYGDLGELVLGTKEGRESSDEVTLFKSVGLAIQDSSVALAAYTRARDLGLGVEFQF
jgi:ornithine cyclodeaminase/alanine dehydrogenase